nr:MAG TPA: hypothetical protein [Caudoviricetes sp.]
MRKRLFPIAYPRIFCLENTSREFREKLEVLMSHFP